MEKATEAREKDKQGTELEAIKLAVVNSVASGLDGFVDTTALKSGLNGLIQENPEDVIVGDGPWVVTSTLGRVYEINKNSIVNELTGLVLTPKSLTLTIEGDTYEEKTITARLIDIEGTLTWSESTDIIDVTPSADGMSATIKAKKGGTDKITVTCSNGDISECTIKVETNKKPIGEYIQYAIGYTDINDSTKVYTANDGLGWRILDVGSKDLNGNYTGVKIISTGIPASLYYHGGKTNNVWYDNEQTDGTGNSFAAAAGLKNNFASVPLIQNGSTSTNNQGYYNSITVADADKGIGWDAAKGTIFMTTKATEVHNLTLDELNKAEGYTTTDNITASYPPSNNDIDELFNLGYRYWLASPCLNGEDIRSVDANGSFGYGGMYGNKYSGLRPVITLNSNIYKDGEIWKIR